MKRAGLFGGVVVLVLYLCGTRATAAPYSFTELANTNTTMPGGGLFTYFQSPAGDGSTSSAYTFLGGGGTKRGVYWASPTLSPGLNTYVDKPTGPPTGSGPFTNLENLSFAGMGAAFNGTTTTQAGIYDKSGAYSTVANRSTVMPGGTETFTSFGRATRFAIISGGTIPSVAFTGAGATDRGVFVWRSSPALLTRAAGPATPVPGGSAGETFTAFGAIAKSREMSVMFAAMSTGGRAGLYFRDGVSGVITPRADSLATPVPGGAAGKTFTGFAVGDFPFTGAGYTFYADTSTGSSGAGAYDALYRGVSPTSFYRVAAIGTLLPTAAGSVAASEIDESLVYEDATVFHADLAGGGTGVYLASTGASSIERILATGDALGGKNVVDVTLGKFGSANPDKLHMVVAFTDGSQAIYYTLVPEPTSAAALAAAMLLVSRRSQRCRRG